MTARARTYGGRLMLAAALAVAGCASTPRASGPEWTTGRISVRVEASPAQTAQSLSASFELRGSGDSGELRLNSPLGTRLVAARWAPGVAVLTSSDGEQRYGNLEQLSRQALGENLPLAALPDWLAARPWPGAPHRTVDGGFEQLGWLVQLSRRSEGWIEATRAAAPAVTVKVRLDEPEP